MCHIFLSFKFWRSRQAQRQSQIPGNVRLWHYIAKENYYMYILKKYTSYTPIHLRIKIFFRDHLKWFIIIPTSLNDGNIKYTHLWSVYSITHRESCIWYLIEWTGEVVWHVRRVLHFMYKGWSRLRAQSRDPQKSSDFVDFDNNISKLVKVPFGSEIFQNKLYQV